MKTLKEELIDFLRDYRREFELNNAITYIPETTWIDGYLKNIRSSSRLCERRANGSNNQEKEVCPKTGFCNIAEQYGFCPYQCALFNREQTD